MNGNIFSKTYGIDVKILIDNSKEEVGKVPPTHSIIQAASQYNGAEAINSFTPLVGLEYYLAKQDPT